MLYYAKRLVMARVYGFLFFMAMLALTGRLFS